MSSFSIRFWRIISMGRLALLLPAIATVAPFPAWALDCSSTQTQAEMNQCVAQEHKRADGELNEAYSTVMAKLEGDEEARSLLRAAQRAWIKFRDAQCDFATSASRGGSIHPTLVASCLTELSDRRTEELRSAVDCEEGDLSCPL